MRHAEFCFTKTSIGIKLTTTITEFLFIANYQAWRKIRRITRNYTS